MMSSFVIVRHPFERLVYAYEDKIFHPKPKLEFHKQIQDEIKQKRKKGEHVNIELSKELLMTEEYQKMLRTKVSRVFATTNKHY